VRRPAVIALAALIGAACDAPFEFQAQVAAIHVIPDTLSLQAGDSVQLSAQVTDSSGHVLSATVYWSSSVDSAATVSSRGLVRSLAPGIVVIRASAGGVNDSARLFIAPYVAGIGFDQGSVVTVPGASIPFTAYAIDRQGNTFVAPLLTWSSSDTTVFTVSSSGVVQARGVGVAELGAGTRTTRGTTPIRVIAPVFQSVSAGEADHTCGVTTDSLAFCWGAAGLGQLGVPGVSSVPAPVTRPNGLAFTAVHSGGTFTCGDSPTKVYCWGSNFRGRLGIGIAGPATSAAPLPPFLTVIFHGTSTGWNDTCGLSFTTLICWGESPTAGEAPNSVQYFPTLLTSDSVLVSLDVSVEFACGLTAYGSPMCWGDNSTGQLGNGSGSSSYHPVPVAGGYAFVAIGGGNSHACGLTAAGAVYCWGNNSNGQLGTGDTVSSPTPELVVTGVSFGTLDAGGAQTCALAADSTAYCWGLGTSTPTPVTGGRHFKTISVGDRHVCGLGADGRVYCWGANDRGQLGDGTFVNRPSPTLVLGQP